ncbi:MAG: hypothetical protein ETSY1_02800 [Candidatus Entotheonella factor]|uniref:Glycosyltransferase subfamily 4-like N-terminal domain-containing protein n=1 Tax=Entotheonella factor TaxID=1429438 RepID=W4LX10_ENTF1|nr:glycosyltransferase [Candidatus Entotheonella palauensis]ETX02649.1 MAG: hypothetical protein ETSY1_02800 [Candidatus Entotheonella factor]
MHILIVTTSLPSPGHPNSLAPLREQIESLRDLGIDISILEVRGRTRLKYLGGIRSLWRCLSGVDLVHGHHGYCGWVARCQWACPVVVSFMGEDTLGMSYRTFWAAAFYRAVALANRWLAAWVDAVIVKSAEMQTALKWADAHVIPNGVNTALFRPLKVTSARADLGWSQDHKYILFGANPNDSMKNFPLAQQAVLIAQEQLGESLTLVPLQGIDHHLVPIYMNACDVMLFTSHQEGSPNVVKEAMACNLPVVSVPVADVPWLFEGASGYRLCCPNAHDLARGLIETLTADHLSVNGAQSIVDKHLTIQKTALKVAEIYERVLQSKT